MVLIKEEIPAEMVQYHEAPTVRPERPSAVPLLRPYVPMSLTGRQENYEFQFQIPGYNPFGSYDEASSPRPSVARHGSADSDDTASNRWTPTSSRAPSEQPTLQEQNWARGYAIPAGTTRAGAAAQGVNLPNQTLCDYQMQLMLLEQQNKKRLTHGMREPEPNHPLAPYTSGLIQLERENKERLMAARQEQDTHNSEPAGVNAQNDYENRMNGFEEQNNPRLRAPTKAPQRFMDPRSGSGQGHALQDYNTQLRLLEQQNKKRLVMARHSQQPLSSPGVGGWNAQKDYEMQLQLLEEQNKRRKMAAKNEGQRVHLPWKTGKDFEMQANHLNEQYKQQVMNAGQDQSTYWCSTSRNHALQDYQMQLMLKEQRDKQARLVIEGLQNGSLVQQQACPAMSEAAAVDYQKQLELLEQQKEYRSRMAAQKEAAAASVEAYSEAYAQVDIETQCGVIGANGKACHGLLSCREHGWTAKRSVRGRSAPFDQLLNAQQANAAAIGDKAFELRGPRPDQETFF